MNTAAYNVQSKSSDIEKEGKKEKQIPHMEMCCTDVYAFLCDLDTSQYAKKIVDGKQTFEEVHFYNGADISSSLLLYC